MRGALFDNAIRVLLPIPALLVLACLPLTAAEVTEEIGPAIKEPPAEEAAVEESANESRAPDRARPRSAWGPHAESRIYGLSYIKEDEPDGTRLQGISLLWSNWDETVDFNGGLGWWVAYQDGGGQTIYSGGFEATWSPWVPRAPLRFGPRFRLGLEHRRSDPDEGFGGLAAAGVELAFWIGDSLQIAVIADREWPFRAEDRTQFGVALRFARRRY
jgi:hypothetical protein